MSFKTTTAAGAVTTAMTIDSSQRVGIGTTGPASVLHINQPGDSNGITLSHASRSGIWKIYHSGVDSENLAFVQNNGTDAVSYLMGRDIHYWQTANVERARIDSSGRLLVGTSSSASENCTLQVRNNSALAAEFFTSSDDAAGPYIHLTKSRGTAASPTEVSSGDTLGAIAFLGHDGATYRTGARIVAEADGTWTDGGDTTDNPTRLVFSTTADGASSPTERMRITNGGDIHTAGRTSASLSTTGCTLEANGAIWAVRSGGTVGVVNRRTDDGNLIEFYQADTLEGAISVSGTTVTYGGGHLARWSQLPNEQDPSELLKGTVMSNLDEMCEWGEEDNEQLNKTKVSDVEGDPNVAGVFVSTSFDEDGPLDFFVAMTGDMIIRIAEGVTVQRGDLLMSAGDGTAKPQDDDIIRSKTIAKVTSTHVTCTYDDGSYCVPCVLMAC